MDFSVIVPAYNREHLIGATLNAIFSQTHPPAEVIVVDDGSTDGTVAIASRWPNCTVIRLENGGAANARHRGVLAASSPWLAFCDSDDIWRPQHLATLAEAFRQSAAEFGFTNFAIIQGDGWSETTKFDDAPAAFWTRFAPRAPRFSQADTPIFAELLKFQPIFPSCVGMSRRFYDKVGGYDAPFGLLPSEDLEFTLRCVQHAPVIVAHEPTVGIRKHPGNSSSDLTKQLWGEVRILAHSRAHHGIGPDWFAAIDEEIVRRAGQAIDAAFAHGAWDILAAMAPHVPPHRRSFKQKVKVAITAFPRPMADVLRHGLLSLGR